MDADNDICTYKVRISDHNGVQYEHGSEEEDVPVEVSGIPEKSVLGVGPDASSETVSELSCHRMADTSSQEIEEHLDVHVDNNGSPTSKEVETKEAKVKEFKPQNSRGKGKNERPSNNKNSIVTSVSKEVKATSNGTLAANTRPKQPVVKTKSFNDRHVTNSNLSKTTKPAPATSNTHKAKVPKSETISGSDSDNLVRCEDAVEKPKLKPLRKAPSCKTEGNGESVESPNAEDAKPRRVGKLPSYGFSFRCDERAERRKEFYTKLEEKIHAQEVEKNNLQAKSKETQEAEIKMLRKSLNFKATPMPSFYQEPPPPKVELKKIPTTRPRSPKLGRKKNSSSVDTEGDDIQSHQLGRLSLDEKAVSQNKPIKGPSPLQSKRPQRKSLPRLPSEKTSMSKNAIVQDNLINGSSAPIARIEEEVPLSDMLAPIARIEEDVLLSNAAESHPGTENGPLIQDQAQPRIEQGVTLEH